MDTIKMFLVVMDYNAAMAIKNDRKACFKLVAMRHSLTDRERQAVADEIARREHSQF